MSAQIGEESKVKKTTQLQSFSLRRENRKRLKINAFSSELILQEKGKA